MPTNFNACKIKTKLMEPPPPPPNKKKQHYACIMGIIIILYTCTCMIYTLYM